MDELVIFRHLISLIARLTQIYHPWLAVPSGGLSLGRKITYTHQTTRKLRWFQRPSPTSVIQSNGRVMAVAPSIRQRVPSRIAPTIIQAPSEQKTAHPVCLSDRKPKPSAPIGFRLPGPCTGAADIASTNISRRWTYKSFFLYPYSSLVWCTKNVSLIFHFSRHTPPARRKLKSYWIRYFPSHHSVYFLRALIHR